jgi:hypothetical protein
MTVPLAIACASGAFKGVFVHGVLSAFEAAGARGEAYAAASSSVVAAGCAAVGLARSVGIDYWLRTIRLRRQGATMSEVVLQSLAAYGPLLRERLLDAESSRLLVATSAVGADVAEETQGPNATRLGRRLLVAAGRGDRVWAARHLATRLFDTEGTATGHALTVENFDAVVYASTRMLHAWEIPAWIDGRPYIDASYTCACPVVELTELGYRNIVAIATEPGPLYRDMFRRPMPQARDGVTLEVLRPDFDPAERGVAFTGASEEGLLAVYRHGQDKGARFAAALSGDRPPSSPRPW